MVAPKLRFKEFDGDWSQVKLKDLVLSLDAGVSVNGEDVSVTEDDFSVLKTSCVSLGTFNPDERKKVTLEHEIQRLKEPLLDNSLVMNRSNTPLLVGSSAFIKKAPKKTYLSDKLWQFKVNQNANIQWIAFYFSNETTLTKLRDMATGTSNSMKNITKPDVLNIDLFAPQKAEQTKIASFLSSVDEKISQLTQKHELLSQYKQGMMQKLFSQQIRFKADDGSEFGEWINYKIFNLAKDKTLNNGVFNDQNKVGKGYKLINVLDMYIQRDIDESRLSLLDLDKKEFENNKVNYGDIFFTRSSLVKEGIAFSNVYLGVSDDITYDGHLIKLSPDLNMVEPKFLNYCLKIAYVRKQLIQGGKTATMTTIGQKEVGNTIVKVPCLEEQTKIANFLSSIDQKIEVVAQQIEQARTWKKGLLQQMFV